MVKAVAMRLDWLDCSNHTALPTKLLPIRTIKVINYSDHYILITFHLNNCGWSGEHMTFSPKPS